MKTIRVICLVLMAALLLTMSVGCSKKPQDEDLGVVDTLEPGKNDTKDPDDSKDPADTKDPDDSKEPADTKDPADSKDPDDTKDPDDSKEPDNSKDPDDTKDPDDSKEPANGNDPSDEPGEEVKPVEKENSGVPLTFVSQNVKHAGYTAYGEKGDGTSANIYNRLRRFKSMVMANDPDIIFYNEAKETAKRFFNEDPYMSQVYDFVWQDRHSTLPGHLMSEPVLWKTDKFTTLETGHFWISPTPNKEGEGFGGQAGADVSTWAKLKVKKTGEIIYAYCLHTDPNNHDACVGALQLYFSRFKQMEKNAYAFVGGDYNCYYRSETYMDMMDWSQMVDLRDVALHMKEDGLTTLGGLGSGHNLAFNKENELTPSVSNPDKIKTAHQIDYVMMKPNAHVAVDHYGFDYTVYDYKQEGIAHGHISDHWGLVVKVRINTEADYSQYQREPYDFEGGPMYQNFEMKFSS